MNPPTTTHNGYNRIAALAASTLCLLLNLDLSECMMTTNNPMGPPSIPTVMAMGISSRNPSPNTTRDKGKATIISILKQMEGHGSAPWESFSALGSSSR